MDMDNVAVDNVARLTAKDKELSGYAAERVAAQPKQCWQNSFRALELPQLRAAEYVEGWAVVDTEFVCARRGRLVVKRGWRVVEHGWLVLNDVVVDPTFPDDEATYFVGLAFSRRRLRRLAKSSKKLPLAPRLGFPPQYRAALEAAKAFCATGRKKG